MIGLSKSWKPNSLFRSYRSHLKITAMNSRPSSDMSKFRERFHSSKHVVVLTGAGVSAESGVPTFRGKGGLWRTFAAQDLATPGAFRKNPSLVWEFYHYRREVMITKFPNPAHIAIAEAQKRLRKENRQLVVITQNIDELHKKAGTDGVIELHGSLFKTRCTNCEQVLPNRESPICTALNGKGDPDLNVEDARISETELPRCKQCSGLLRPHVVWFGEEIDPHVYDKAYRELEKCDLCLVIGTSSVVYPAAMFAPMVAERGIPVAEFNIEYTPSTEDFGYYFDGPCGSTLPLALAPKEN